MIMFPAKRDSLRGLKPKPNRLEMHIVPPQIGSSAGSPLLKDLPTETLQQWTFPIRTIKTCRTRNAKRFIGITGAEKGKDRSLASRGPGLAGFKAACNRLCLPYGPCPWNSL